MSRIDKNTDFFAYVDNFAKYKHIESIRLYGEHKNISPKVSITIPTYRRPELLKEAVESAINQDGYDDYEIIIIDNDATGEFTVQIIEILKSFASDKVVYYRNQENIGMFGNWNRCIELANGEWMTILNDDDMISAGYLNVMSSILKKAINVDRVDCEILRFSDVKSIKNRGVIQELTHSSKLYKVNFKAYILDHINGCMHSMLMCKHKCIELGGFNENYFPSSDYIFTANYAMVFPNVIKTEILLAYYRKLVGESFRPVVRLGFAKRYKQFAGELLRVYNGSFIEKCFYRIHLYLKFYSLVAKNSLLWKLRFRLLYKIHSLLFSKIKNKYIRQIECK